MAEDGVIKTWGWGEHGQLGLGNSSDQTRPQAVSLGRGVEEEKAAAPKIKVYCGSGFTIVVITSLLRPHQQLFECSTSVIPC